MDEPTWGTITGGATFEALVKTIVYFEHPKNAALFGRAGKDGGQDARVDHRVFQAKHHQPSSAAAALRDAKKEASKVKEYRRPSHPRSPQWNGVTHWRLVTNAGFNPTDREEWEREVVPLFAEQGLVAEYWERADLNALLAKHPEIKRAYFGNETRAFLTVPELREQLPRQEPFLQRDQLGEFFGREAELKAVREFLQSSALFLVLDGRGGIGKTRLLLAIGEAIAEDDWQVLWANLASMASSGTWFNGLVPERQTLLLVDEPPDDQVLQQLAEQAGSRAASWKVIVAVRSPKDPVLRFLFGTRMTQRVRKLSLAPLSDDAATEMCDDLLRSGKLNRLINEEARRRAARELARRFESHPVWLTLAVHLLEERGDLSRMPDTARDLADEYLAGIVRDESGRPVERVRDLLRWVALLGRVNREDRAALQLISRGIDEADELVLRQQLATLVRRGALAQWGARDRFVELKPDVLRDHVLRSWLVVDQGFGSPQHVASTAALQLVQAVKEAVTNGTAGALEHAILTALARIELLMRLADEEVPFLTPFFDKLRSSIATMSVSRRLKLLDMLDEIAPFQPVAVTSIVREMRQSTGAEEKVQRVFGSRFIGQDDVVLALAMPLFNAAIGSVTNAEQQTVIRELCHVIEAEAEIAPRLKRGLPNDGKRAAALLEQMLEGGPRFWADFNAAAGELGEELIVNLTTVPATPSKAALLKALVGPAIAIERRQTWSEEHHIHIRTFAIGPDHPGWTTRNRLLTRIKQTLSDDSAPVASRAALWCLFADSHRNLNGICRSDDASHKEWLNELRTDLIWAYGVLAPRKASIAELSEARDLWRWHLTYGQDRELRDWSAKLELLYQSNSLANEFEPLFGGRWEQQGERAAEKAEALSKATSPSEIADFVGRAVQFLGGESELHRLGSVAWALGRLATTNDVVGRFVRESLATSKSTPRVRLVCSLAASWVVSERKDQPQRTHLLVSDLMAACGSDDVRTVLLLHVYDRVPRPVEPIQMSPEEHQLLREQEALFESVGRSAEFIAISAASFHYDWPALRPMLERVIRSLGAEQRSAAIVGLINSISWASRDAPEHLPPEFSEWLLDQLLLVRDLDDLNSNAEWHLNEILKHVEKLQLAWLPKALSRRRDLEQEGYDDGVRAIGHHSKLGEYVEHITESDADDPTIRRNIEEMLSFVDDRGGVGYHLPTILRDIDPNGLLVPRVVCERIAAATETNLVHRLAHIGAAYFVGTAPWRLIAKAALKADASHREDEHHILFGTLARSGIRTWHGRPDEVPAIFTQAVIEAKQALESEPDPELRPFWEWQLSVAEDQLEHEEQRVKEERGE